MMEGEPEPEPRNEPEATLFPAKVGEKLRAAREAQNIELADIAARTRIPQRHLEAIERSNYASLPSITYAIGFAKAFARAVELDEVAIARDLRIELGAAPAERAPAIPSYQAYQADDGSRGVPSSMAWLGALVAVLVLAGVGVWYGTDWLRGDVPPPETLSAAADPSPTPSPAAQTGGQVSLVARANVWLRVTDANGNRLIEKEMLPGERFDVPPDANGPIARTGRPDQIQVLLNGSEIAPLGTGQLAVEVPVGADALRARDAASPVPTPTPVSVQIPARRPASAALPPAPVPSASPSPAASPAATDRP